MTFVKPIPASDIQPAEQSNARWKDWKWQVGHSITDLSTLEQMLDLKMSASEREDMQKTCDIFPMSITPYYLSLIDTQDPFHDRSLNRQSLLSENSSLRIMISMIPWQKMKTAPAPSLPIGIRTGFSFLSVIPVPCTAGIAHEREK